MTGVLLGARRHDRSLLGGSSSSSSASEGEEAGSVAGRAVSISPGQPAMRVVLMTGFESFNVALYKQAARRLAGMAVPIQVRARSQACPPAVGSAGRATLYHLLRVPQMCSRVPTPAAAASPGPHQRASRLTPPHPLPQVSVFSDRDIPTQRDAITAALAEADVFFGSLLFDYDQVGGGGGVGVRWCAPHTHGCSLRAGCMPPGGRRSRAERGWTVSQGIYALVRHVGAGSSQVLAAPARHTRAGGVAATTGGARGVPLCV
jgi:hypothetical protein